jgi:hypothetical protein
MEISSIVRNFALNNGVEFDDPDSYQSKALAWIEDSGVPSLRVNLANADDRVVQRYALACIYYASNEQRTAATDVGAGILRRGWMVVF